MKEYPIDYLGPKAGKSDDAEWLAVTEYKAFRHIINADWSYSDFDCWLAARDTLHVRIGEKNFTQAVQEFKKINTIIKSMPSQETFQQNIHRQMDNVNQVKQELEHIRSPYTLNQILDFYCKGTYNAEHLLQHCLKILINNNFKYDGAENI